MDGHALGDRIDHLLAILWEHQGTDLILTVGMPPQLRLDGELTSAGGPVLSAADTEGLLDEALSPAQRVAREGMDEYDFAFTWRDTARIRGNAFVQRGLTAVALRMIPRDIPSMADLGLPPTVAQMARQHQGLILFTGPTNSGKSTSLASVVDMINTERACHVITIEDPIEYVHDHKRSVVNQREVGSDTASFPTALRAALREDPDVLLVGEMRDLESIAFAITVAETGHLVLGTLHTNDTAQSVARVIDVFPADRQAQIRVQLSAALSGVVYQRLIPRIGGGMVAAFEVLVANPAVRNLIRDGKTHQLRNTLTTGRGDGMQTFEHSLSTLVQEGAITYEDAVARSLYPEEIDGRARFRASVTA